MQDISECKVKTPTLNDPDFGISWNGAVNSWRLVLGNERCIDDPFIQEYFGVSDYGTIHHSSFIRRGRLQKIVNRR